MSTPEQNDAARYALLFYCQTTAQGKRLDLTDSNLAETLKRCGVAPHPACFPAIRRVLANDYGVTDRVEEVIRESGGDDVLVARVVEILNARSTTELMDDYRETLRTAGYDASQARRWITAELTQRIGRDSVIEFEARAPHQDKEREITARDARKGDIYVSRLDGHYTRSEIISIRYRNRHFIELVCADHTVTLEADQPIIVERDDDAAGQREDEKENHAALDRATAREGGARHARATHTETEDPPDEPAEGRQYERVAAGDIQVGDRVARARTHTFVKVAAINRGVTAVRLLDEHGATIARPRKTAQLWRITERGCRG